MCCSWFLTLFWRFPCAAYLACEKQSAFAFVPQVLRGSCWQVCDHCLGNGHREGSVAGQRDPDWANMTLPHMHIYLPVSNWKPAVSLLYRCYGSDAHRLILGIWGEKLAVVTAESRGLSPSQGGWGHCRALCFSIALFLAMVMTADNS